MGHQGGDLPVAPIVSPETIYKGFNAYLHSIKPIFLFLRPFSLHPPPAVVEQPSAPEYHEPPVLHGGVPEGEGGDEVLLLGWVRDARPLRQVAVDRRGDAGGEGGEGAVPGLGPDAEGVAAVFWGAVTDEVVVVCVVLIDRQESVKMRDSLEYTV